MKKTDNQTLPGSDKIFVDPTYEAYNNNGLFALHDPNLNRDNSLMPYVRFKDDMTKRGLSVETSDQIKNYSDDEVIGAGYISLGNMKNFEEVARLRLRPLAFFIMEPPLIINKTYRDLPKLTRFFERVFVHNVTGDKYSLDNVHQERLRKFYWPQPYTSVLTDYWKNSDRKCAVIIINGHHRPKRMFKSELYSKRIILGVQLNKFIPVDLYGRGWDRLFTISNLWLPYLRNYLELRKIYRGMVASKHEVMSRYDFSLCLENQSMNGYITEKIFDCFYSGVIPIYKGGDDIANWIPSECYIDLNQFSPAEELAKFLHSMSSEQKNVYRRKAKEFLESDEGSKYHSLTWLLDQ